MKIVQPVRKNVGGESDRRGEGGQVSAGDRHVAEISVQIFCFVRPMLVALELSASARGPASGIFRGASVLGGSGKGVSEHFLEITVGHGQPGGTVEERVAGDKAETRP